MVEKVRRNKLFWPCIVVKGRAQTYHQLVIKSEERSANKTNLNWFYIDLRCQNGWSSMGVQI